MKTKYMISEGIKYKNSTFTFDFKHDDKTDIIALTDNLFSSVSYDNTYFYQYEFGPDISSKLRSEFIHALKFDQNVLGLDNINRFIDRAMTNLNKAINLSTVDIVIYPQSSSSLTRDIVDRIDSFTDSEKYIKLELAIELIKSIKDKKILIIDDIYTSGITIEQIIKAYQMLTPDDSNTLTIFTLIGKKKEV